VANNESNDADNQVLNGNLLAWSAARAARWPHLYSGLIERYLELNDLSEDDLCALLKCDRATLNHLRLCGRPDPDPAEFAIDIRRVADKLSLDAGMLASIVREVDTADAFSRAQRNTSLRKGPANPPFSSTAGMLKAARDHEDTTEPEDTTNGDGEAQADGPDRGEPGTGS